MILSLAPLQVNESSNSDSLKQEIAGGDCTAAGPFHGVDEREKYGNKQKKKLQHSEDHIHDLFVRVDVPSNTSAQRIAFHLVGVFDTESLSNCQKFFGVHLIQKFSVHCLVSMSDTANASTIRKIPNAGFLDRMKNPAMSSNRSIRRKSIQRFR
jgi:hypothetical protein